jgi:hypothetical protein
MRSKQQPIIRPRNRRFFRQLWRFPEARKLYPKGGQKWLVERRPR